MKKLLVFLVLLIFSGCVVIHSGGINSGPLLDIKDQYIDIVNGESRSVFILGFGNLKNDQLILLARKNMYSSRRLNINEYYSNLTTDISRKYILWPLIQITKVTVSADVLKANDSINPRYGHSFSKMITPFIDSKNNSSEKRQTIGLRNGDEIVNGDSIFYYRNTKDCPLYVVSNIDKESVILLGTDPEHGNILVPISRNTFFIKNTIRNGFRFGSKVSLEIFDKLEGKDVQIKGLVFGFSKSYALIKAEEQFYIKPVDKIQKTD